MGSKNLYKLYIGLYGTSISLAPIPQWKAFWPHINMCFNKGLKTMLHDIIYILYSQELQYLLWNVCHCRSLISPFWFPLIMTLTLAYFQGGYRIMLPYITTVFMAKPWVTIYQMGIQNSSKWSLWPVAMIWPN